MKYIKTLIDEWKIIFIFSLVSLIFFSYFLIGDSFPWISDLSRQYFPWYLTLHKSLHNFSLPLWIPEMGNGYPLYAQGEAGVFYPLYGILIFFFSPEFGFKLIFLIHFVAMSFGVYLLCRKLNLSKIASIWTSLVFTYSFFWITKTHHLSILVSGSFLPWGLLIIESYFTDFRRLLLLSLVIFLQIVSGHPQISLISIVVYLVYFTLKPFWQARVTRFRFLLIIVLGIGLGSMQIIPTLVLTHNSDRSTKKEDFLFAYSLPKSQFLTYTFPYLFRITPQNSNLGFTQFGGHYWEFALYIGIAPFLLAISTIKDLKNPQILIWWLIWLLFCILAIGGYWWWYRGIIKILHLPIRVSSRFLLPATLAISILSGFGLDQLLTNSRKIWSIFKVIAQLILSIIFIVTILTVLPEIKILTILKNFLSIFGQKIIFTEFQKIGFVDFSLLKVENLYTSLLLISALIFVWLFNKQKISKTVLFILFFGVWIVDVFLTGFLYQDRTNKLILSPTVEFNSFINNPQARVFTLQKPTNIKQEKDTMQPNINLVWQINSFNNVTPLALLNSETVYADYVKDLSKIGELGVTHLINQNGEILKVLNPYPQVFLSSDINYANSNAKIGLNNISQIKKDALYNSYLVNSNNESWFIQLESFYPEWHAFINGVETKIYPANSIFRAIKLTPGMHKIEFKFIPTSLYFGLATSFISLLTVLIIYKMVKHEN